MLYLKYLYDLMPPADTPARRTDVPMRRQPLAALLRCCAPLRSVALRAPSFGSFSRTAHPVGCSCSFVRATREPQSPHPAPRMPGLACAVSRSYPVAQQSHTILFFLIEDDPEGTAERSSEGG